MIEMCNTYQCTRYISKYKCRSRVHKITKKRRNLRSGRVLIPRRRRLLLHLLNNDVAHLASIGASQVIPKSQLLHRLHRGHLHMLHPHRASQGIRVEREVLHVPHIISGGKRRIRLSPLEGRISRSLSQDLRLSRNSSLKTRSTLLMTRLHQNNTCIRFQQQKYNQNSI